MAPRIPASPANAPMRGTRDAFPAESSACALASASRSASRSSSSSTSLRLRTSISTRTVLPHEHVELAYAVDDAEAVRLRDAARAVVPVEDGHSEPRGRVPLDSVGEDRTDELAAAPLPDQLGPHPVADVDGAGLLLDAGNARLRADAAEADEVAFVVVHREEP